MSRDVPEAKLCSNACYQGSVLSVNPSVPVAKIASSFFGRPLAITGETVTRFVSSIKHGRDITQVGVTAVIATSRLRLVPT